ncbi:MAG: hypothetical protein K6G22_13165 [Lachnospiraceae bacterium]|nr:hypothetical protein [Lachnospiraceae bacterium]
MACFLVPAAEALVVTAVKKAEEKKTVTVSEEKNADVSVKEERVPLSKKLGWLTGMLWGGVILLAFEHIWHGEVVPYFPFLTAMSDPAERAVMLHEMATVGVCMAVLITGVWFGVCMAADAIIRRPAKEAAEKADK